MRRGIEMQTAHSEIDTKFAGHRMSVKKLFPVGAELAAELLDESNGSLVAVAEDGTVRSGVCRLRQTEIASLIATARNS